MTVSGSEALFLLAFFVSLIVPRTRRKLTKVGESESISYVVERDDNPTVEGTAFSASTMNNLEDRISNITIDPASFSEDGLFTSEEKTKLNGIQEGATKNSITRSSIG